MASDFDLGDGNPDPSSADFILAEQRGSIAQAVGNLSANPDEAARAVELSKATGVPAPVIGANLENFETQHKAALTANLLRDNSYLQRFLISDPMAAKIANDDYANLDAVSQRISGGWSLWGATKNAIHGMMQPDPAFGEGGIGSWIPPQEWHDRPLTASVASVLGAPLELFSRTSNAFITELASTFLPKKDAENFAQFVQDPGLAASLQGMGPAGGVAAGMAEVLGKFKPIEGYLRNNRQPPPNLLPEFDKAMAEDNAKNLDQLKELTADAQASLTRERSPDTFAEFVRQHTNAEIAVSGDAAAALYGDKLPEPTDGLLGWVPDIQAKLDLARSTGSDVSIPLADWLAKVDPKVFDVLHDDIRVRPQGITAREAAAGVEGDAARGGPLPPPLPEELPAVRAAGALEPMFSIGDRDLKLQRMAQEQTTGHFGPEQGFHDFNIMDQNGNSVGYLNLSTQEGGKKLYVDMISGVNGLGPSDFGPALMRSILRQIKAEFPEAETISGHRVSGARERAGKEMFMPEATIKLDDPGKIDLGVLQKVLEGGSWETYSPAIQAYIKPYEGRGPRDRALIDIVNSELDRITPKKLQVQEAQRIESTAFGDRVQPTGAYIPYNDAYPILLYSLEGKDPLGTARHEAIHHLRSYGFFDQKEWSILEQASKDNSWIEKFGIDQRYAKGSPSLKLEESIADAYKDWARGADAPSPEVHGIFEKMKAFFERIKERIGQLLGKDPTWEDIFKKVDTGEVGSREGTTPLDPRAYNEPMLNVEQFRRAANDNSAARMAEFAEKRGRYERENTEHADWQAELDRRGAEINDILNKPDFSEFDAARVNKLEGQWRDLFDRGPSLDEKLSIGEDPQGGSRVFERASALGMPVENFRRYAKLIEERHTADIAAAEKRALAERGREQTKEWKENRKALRVEVADDIRNRPDVAADLFFGSGELYGKKVPLGSVKLDASKLTEEQKNGLPRQYYGQHGMAPDDIANLFGYGSGDALVGRLVEYNAAKLQTGMSAKDFVSRVIDVETDRQMGLRYGVLEDNIMDAAKEQAASETQLNILHEETHALGLRIGEAPLNKSQIEGQLRDQFAKMPLGDVSSDKWMRAAGKAGRAAEDALLRNDPSGAFRAKQQQYYATVIAKEAVALEKELGKFAKIAKQFSKREVPSVDQSYTNFVHDILQRVGRPVRRSVQDIATEVEAGEYKSLQDFVEGKRSYYLRELEVAEFLQDPSFRKGFEELTTEEFRGVDDSIRSLIANGRDEKKITKAGASADLAEIKGQMINQLQEFAEKTYDAKGGRWMGPIPPTMAKYLRSYGTAHIQMENLFNRWDHDNPNGVFQQYVMRDLVDAANSESAMEKRYAAKLHALDDKADLKASVDNTLFKVPGTDQLLKLNRNNLRAILLNAGNDSNLRVMAKGYGLEPAEVLGWLHRYATKEDWDWAQKVGDVFKEIKGEADVMYRNLSGIAPKSIPLEPIQTPHGTYAGWYYPLIAHAEFPTPIRKMMGKDALEQQGFVRSTVGNGYTKDRTGATYPLALDLDMMPARLKQMIHDVAMRPAVVNASKIFYDKDILKTVFTRFGGEWRDMLQPYLVDVANSANYVPKDQRMFMQASEFMRQNIISTLVGLNPGTVMKHGPTALVQSLHEVGVVDFLKAMKGLYSINERTGESNAAFAIRNSEELQRRDRNYIETLSGVVDLAQPNSGAGWLRSRIQQLSSKPVALSDWISAVPTWLAQYEKTLADGATHGDAVYMADRAVRRAHGSVAITNRSAVMRGGALSQWFASVYGFFNHIMNRQYELLWKSGEALGMAKEGNYADAMAKAPELTSMLFAYVLAPALIEEMVTPLISDEKESWGKKAAKGVGFTLGASWVGVRDVASAILNGRDPAAGLLGTSWATISNFARDLNKKDPLGKAHAGKVVQDGATLLGALTGAVPAQVGKSTRFGLGVATGAERPKGPWGWLTGLRFGTLDKHPGSFQEWQRHHFGGH